jgi:hypothetical protein
MIRWQRLGLEQIRPAPLNCPSISVVATVVTSRYGWFIWTPMKISPAAAAAIPVVRKRVIAMIGLFPDRSAADAAEMPET